MQEIEEMVKKLDDMADVEHPNHLIQLRKIKRKETKTESCLNRSNISDLDRRFSDDIDYPDNNQVTPVSL